MGSRKSSFTLLQPTPTHAKAVFTLSPKTVSNSCCNRSRTWSMVWAVQRNPSQNRTSTHNNCTYTSRTINSPDCRIRMGLQRWVRGLSWMGPSLLSSKELIGMVRAMDYFEVMFSAVLLCICWIVTYCLIVLIVSLRALLYSINNALIMLINYPISFIFIHSLY